MWGLDKEELFEAWMAYLGELKGQEGAIHSNCDDGPALAGVIQATLRHVYEELQKKVVDALNTPYDGLVVLTPEDLANLKQEAGL